MRDAVIAFCAEAGTDPLLVQGAGGNVSWKEGDALWIKASGTWLAEAARKDIFVPVDLPQLRSELAAGRFDTKPVVRDGATLRPSIETVLHALMQQPVVVHLHAIEVLAHLVHEHCARDLAARLPAGLRWVLVPYRKPGADLAQAVSEALDDPAIQIVFLQNHGVVIGADDPAQVRAIFDQLIAALITPPAPATGIAPPEAALQIGATAYAPVADVDVQRLATDADLFGRLPTEWALYPDHVVFLGARAQVYGSLAEVQEAGSALPELIFIKGVGVFAQASFNTSKLAQLRCYFDVLVRQRPTDIVRSLGMADIGELLNWDAEQYRMGLSKK